MFELVHLRLELLGNDADVLQGCEVSGQMNAQLVAQTVVAVADGLDFTYKDAGREYGAETAGLNNVAYVEARVAWDVVELGVERIDAVPYEVAEIVGATQAAADVRAAVEQRQHYGEML